MENENLSVVGSKMCQYIKYVFINTHIQMQCVFPSQG